MILSESQSRRQRLLGMEHTNFQAQAGTALRYKHNQFMGNSAMGQGVQGFLAWGSLRSR